VTDGTTRHLAVSRRAQVLEALHRHGTVRVSDLAAELDVTAVTVRRDITRLVADGLARRVHGGATLVDAPTARPGPGAGAGSAPRGDAVEHAQHAPPATTAGTAAPATPVGTATIGMLVPSLDYYWPGVARGAEERATTTGLRVRLRGSSYDTEDERPQLERLLTAGDGAAALLVAPALDSPHADDVLDWLAALDVPVVLVERTDRSPDRRSAFESVVTDHVQGAGTAVRHLAGLGHRRIGAALTSHSPHTADLRAGFHRAVAECGLDAVVDVDLPDRRATDFQDRVDALVADALRAGCTGLLVHSDPEAMAVVQHCEDRGVAVPGTLSVVAYDDEVAGLFSPALTAVRPPRAWIGRAAVDLVVARLADPGRPVHRVVVSPSLVVRDSTAPPAG
jgi:DNA-binding LacI/PurR family transcriptional regulator